MKITVPENQVLASEVNQRLLAHFGNPQWRLALNPVDELISTILSQNTNDVNRDRAFNSLKNRFTSWEEVENAEPGLVIDAIKIAGLANQKGPRIQKVLSDIHHERGELNLDFLKTLPRDEARQWLLKFKGVGPKTAAIVLQFSLEMPAFPVDTHIYRVTGRLGLRPDILNVEAAHVFLERAFPPEAYYAAHLNIIRLGREVCHPSNPDCLNCPLNDLCAYFKNHTNS